MTAKSQTDFDRAVEAFFELLARAITRAHLRQSAERSSENNTVRPSGPEADDAKAAQDPST